ncbi:MAG: DUF2177 family protein [Gemmatimonadota bacterium]
MTAGRLVAVYGAMLVAFLALDLLWLGVVARDLYRRHLGSLMRADVHWGAALAFYLIYLTGVLVLAVLPAVEAGTWTRALGLGALLGLVAYAAWDLTNLAVLDRFPAAIVPVDLAWGTFLTAVVALAGYGTARLLG